MNDEVLKSAADIAAAGGIAASILKWLPAIASAAAIVWFTIRIYEWARWVRQGRPGSWMSGGGGKEEEE